MHTKSIHVCVHPYHLTRQYAPIPQHHPLCLVCRTHPWTDGHVQVAKALATYVAMEQHDLEAGDRMKQSYLDTALLQVGGWLIVRGRGSLYDGYCWLMVLLAYGVVGLWCCWLMALLAYGVVGLWYCWLMVLLAYGVVGLWYYWLMALLAYGIVG